MPVSINAADNCGWGLDILSWRWWQQIPHKFWQISIICHGVTYVKIRCDNHTFCAFLLLLRLLDFCCPYWLRIMFSYMYKVWRYVCPYPRNARILLTSTLDRGEWSTFRPCCRARRQRTSGNRERGGSEYLCRSRQFGKLKYS